MFMFANRDVRNAPKAKIPTETRRSRIPPNKERMKAALGL